MATVHLPPSLRQLIGNAEPISIQAGDVRDLVAQLTARYPALSGRVTDERGVLRQHVKIFVNAELAGLENDLHEKDEVRILPSISGGN
ncbi:MAG: sulfur-carrier protein [Actinomycetota bacterium]|nr:sulfur-carrier protein [Actinomycetota bacterium]